jgi:hypothetical protein
MRSFALLAIVGLVIGCGTAPKQSIQPLSGTARMEAGQNGAAQSMPNSTVQGMTPQLPPKGPDGGPL